MKNLPNIILFILGVVAFACIRFFEKTIFYDPLFLFFEGEFQLKAFPDLDAWLYSFNLLFRYFLNTIISLVLIWVCFQSKSYIKFSILLYVIFFVACITLFQIVVHEIEPQSYMLLFYIRRFLIQPLLVIILIPAFYFQKIQKKALT